MLDLDETTREVLKRFRFDAEAFALLQREVAGGGSWRKSRLAAAVLPPTSADLVTLPPRDSAEGDELARLGMAALARGEVGVVVLAGGMATRFGGVVKAVVEVTPGSSFLRVKLGDIQRMAAHAHAGVANYVLTSFSAADQV